MIKPIQCIVTHDGRILFKSQIIVYKRKNEELGLPDVTAETPITFDPKHVIAYRPTTGDGEFDDFMQTQIELSSNADYVLQCNYDAFDKLYLNYLNPKTTLFQRFQKFCMFAKKTNGQTQSPEMENC